VALGCAALLFITACSDQLTSSDEFNSFDSELFKFETLESDISLMEADGMHFAEGDGIFSLGWNEVFRPFDDNSQIKGMAFAVVFGDDNSGSLNFPGRGIDLGTMSIDYSGNSIEMHKMSHDRRGTAYSLFHRPFGESEELLGFIPATDYQFVVSGSGSFSPLTITLTSPTSLMNINSHSHGDVIDITQDLTITWDGGNNLSDVAIRLMPHFRPPGDGINPDGRSGPDGKGGPGGRRGQGPPPPPHHHGENTIIEILSGNPGEYVISSEILQSLVDETGAEKIVIEVSQLDSGEVEHDGKLLTTAMRNGSSVMLDIQ
ncbi:MAG: hypothetical protein PVF17_11770, partial [Ignavibacteria bacterium]